MSHNYTYSINKTKKKIIISWKYDLPTRFLLFFNLLIWLLESLYLLNLLNIISTKNFGTCDKPPAILSFLIMTMHFYDSFCIPSYY